MMSVIKLFLLVLLAGAASALECYFCESGEYGKKCINDNDGWAVKKCPEDLKTCFISLTQHTLNDTAGIAQRGCAKDMNFCDDFLGIRELRVAKRCYVCNTGKCNSPNALDINSSKKTSVNILLLSLPLVLIARKIFPVSG